MKHPVIAIDGGAGTGKTTSAALVAERLGFSYVDSGAVYRAIALALLEAGIDDPDDGAIAGRVETLPVSIEPDHERFRVYLDGREVTRELRTPEVTRFSSKIAVRSEVRARVRQLLRSASGRGPLVVEGRDIGTVVFPDAELKIFLVAAVPVRAERRRQDLARQGVRQSAEEVAKDLEERDSRDSTRTDSPLRKAEGAVEVDTGRTDVDGQVRQILDAYAAVTRRRFSGER